MINTSQHILDERAKNLAQKRIDHSTSTEDYRSMIHFVLANQDYYLDASFAKEILTIKSIVPVPAAADIVAGIYNLRGSILTLINLSLVLNVKSSQAKPHHVIVLEDKASGITCGLLVNEIINTIKINQSEIQTLPQNHSGEAKTLLSGVSRNGCTSLNTPALIKSIHKQLMVTNS